MSVMVVAQHHHMAFLCYLSLEELQEGYLTDLFKMPFGGEKVLK